MCKHIQPEPPMFFNTTQTEALIHMRIRSPYERAHTPYPYEHIRETEPTYHLEIYEVSLGASSSTGTSPPTESVKPKILK